MKNIKWLSGFTCAAVILLTVAILTIQGSLSDESGEKIYSAKLSTKEENVIINDNRIDFYKTLGVGDSYSFELDVTNDGNMDLEILRAIRSDLKEYKVGTSSNTNKTYYLSDYAKLNITYLEDNEENGIKRNDKVQSFDYLRSNTTNKIRIEVRIDKEDVTKDELLALHDTFNKEELDISLYLQLAFKEL